MKGKTSMMVFTLLTVGLGLAGAHADGVRARVVRRRRISKSRDIFDDEDNDSAHPVAVVARNEMRKWAGGLKEDDPRGRALINKYWKASDRGPSEQPWSGAFIVWAANQGLEGSLPKVPGHAGYAAMAIRNGSPDKYTAFPGNLPVRVGDIILKPRPNEARSFDELRGDFFPSHGDIVTEIEDGYAVAIGGNKRNDVSAQEYKLNPDGSARGVFAVLRLHRNFPRIVVEIPGYRRATNAEVTPTMVQEAQKILPRYAPGEVVFGPGYALAVETHANDRLGRHKGVSVFLKGDA